MLWEIYNYLGQPQSKGAFPDEEKGKTKWLTSEVFFLIHKNLFRQQ